MDPKQLGYLIALSRVEGIGSIRLKLLVEACGTPEKVWGERESVLKEILGPKIGKTMSEGRANLDPESLYKEVIDKHQAKVTSLWSEDYPALLKEIADPPVVLYYLGDLAVLRKSIAVVGTRKVTTYGREVTQFLTSELSRAGFCIVSGLARGVDSIAHKSALDSGGLTCAVLGSGLSQVYPTENKSLFDKIYSSGVCVSELYPDTPPSLGTFPARNRIISGLSLGVVITEADTDSGSLITAGAALEQNREVFAVPGSIFSRQSNGTLDLIKQGAKLVRTVEDILEELGMSGEKDQTVVRYEPRNDIEKYVIEILVDKDIHIDEIVRSSPYPSSEINATLSFLEIEGVVKNTGIGLYRKLT